MTSQAEIVANIQAQRGREATHAAFVALVVVSAVCLLIGVGVALTTTALFPLIFATGVTVVGGTALTGMLLLLGLARR